MTSEEWLAIVSSSDAVIWPDWRKKIRHAARRLTLAATLLETGDLEAAAEEMLYAVSHTARAVLLKNGIFPLSRPEIIGQLRDSGHEHLGTLLQDLSYREPTRVALNRNLLYIKRLLVHMDKPAYREFVRLRHQRLRAKKGRSSDPIKIDNRSVPR
ncbi:MAG TPA: HEPN domain-containing protein [Candidatus Sulfotelmatobacter sp.]